MKNTVVLAELTWPEAQEQIASGAPVILPVGATEQHGRHMALNVDVLIPTAIAERAARRIGGDRKSTRLNSSHIQKSRMPSSA